MVEQFKIQMKLLIEVLWYIFRLPFKFMELTMTYLGSAALYILIAADEWHIPLKEICISCFLWAILICVFMLLR